MALSVSCCTPLCFRTQAKLNVKMMRTNSGLQGVKAIVESIGIPRMITAPQVSLQRGNWVKLICGASFEDVVDVRNLSLVYTLAGVDCIDCAADASVVGAVSEGIEAARHFVPLRRPWVMISVNDDEDLHFRKAEFDPEDCPLDCSRPCELVCPANAISLSSGKSFELHHYDSRLQKEWRGGVITERCYGCGRCFPVCPYDKIRVTTYVRDARTTADLLMGNDVDAIEIHTNGRQFDSFKGLWTDLGGSHGCLKLVAISLPDVGESTTALMSSMFSIMKPDFHGYNLWQLDGRPMSGDIGRGATREAVAFAARLVRATDRPPGFLQLAGGTNVHTVDYLKKEGLFQETFTANTLHDRDIVGPPSSWNSPIGGIAYGGYARKSPWMVANSPRANVDVWARQSMDNKILMVSSIASK
ncbi:Light dependent period A-like protein [Drosera capensis]